MLSLVRRIAREQGITVLIVIHDLNLALRYCDRFYFLKDGNTYLYVKGDFEPIISEELFRRCEEIRKSRTTKMIVNKGERTYGKRASQDVWLRKLRCACGSTFRKDKWRTNKRSDTVYGYQCYNQVNNGSKGFRLKNGLDTEGYCDIRMIGD